MDWLVLGSGSCIPSPKRGSTGHALKAGKEIAFFDLGPGTLEKLAKAGWDYRQVNHVFISHFSHCDHANDLATLFMAYKVGSEWQGILRRKPLNVYGPKGLKKFVKDLQRLYPFLKRLGFKVKLFELKPGASKKISLGGQEFSLKAFKALHPGSLSYGLTGKKKIFYSGDTGYHEGLAPAGEKADLMVLECSFLKEHSGHLNPESCGKVAAQAKPKRLLLTHFYGPFKGESPAGLCRRHFKGRVIEARDLLKIKL